MGVGMPATPTTDRFYYGNSSLCDCRQNELGDDVSFGELGLVDGRHGNSLAAQDSFDIRMNLE